MSSLEDIKKVVVERLTAAAEEIFGVFRQKIDEYEEEIDRQRRLLLVVRQPVIKLHRTELPEQLVYKEEEEVLTDQQLCNQELNSSLAQEDPEPPQIKEEEGKLSSSQEGEQLLLKRETDTFILTPVLEENVHVEDRNLDLNPLETLDGSFVTMPVLSSVVSNSDLQLLSNSFHVAEIKDQIEGKHEVCGSNEDAETKQGNQHHKNKCHTEKVCSSTKIIIRCDTVTGKKTFKCETCGKYFKQFRHLSCHKRIHMDEKPYVCTICGKTFRTSDYLLHHKKFHAVGKVFRQRNVMSHHLRFHRDEKPFVCRTCGKRFTQICNLNVHMRIHTREKPFVCENCGNCFSHISSLYRHMRIHTGERPFVCEICGKCFIQTSNLSQHMRIHTGERPYVCKTCGKSYKQANNLFRHTKTHRDKNP